MQHAWQRWILAQVLAAGLVVQAVLPVAARAEEPQARLTRLEQALADDERHVRIWWFGWSGLFAVAGGGQMGLAAIVDNRDFVMDRLVGGTSGFLGVAGMALTPVKPLQTWTPMPDLPLDTRLKLVEAELRARAKREKQVGGWVDHALCVAVAAGAFAYIWLHENRLGSAALMGGMNLAVGEAQLWTVPHTAVHALEPLVEGEVVPVSPED